MNRIDRRRLPCIVAMAIVLAPMAVDAAEPGKLPPERTFSNSPFLHRIPLRDETGNPIPAPKADAKPDTASGQGAQPAAKPFVLDTTCGKCHSDIDVMQHGWHFNFWEKDALHGRAGEPWILTDVHTRTQLPLSYRPWASVTGAKPFHPHQLGINDFNFALTFGRHLPGGGIFAQSQDLRFKMSGPLEIDCLICHTTDTQHDPVLRATEIGTHQNFKWAAISASFVARVQGVAQRLPDAWNPNAPDARPGPRVIYDPDRFDAQGNVTFNVSGPVPNDRCYFCHTTIDVGRPETPSGLAASAASGPTTAPASPIADRIALENRWRHDRDIHLVQGMLCVDCHRNGADHMTVRGYEDEAALRQDDTITTLTCAGCHYGARGAPGDYSVQPVKPMAALKDLRAKAARPPDGNLGLGGRAAAPRPVHKGLPTLHFEKMTCTACHSGPWPEEHTGSAQTSMAHRLGLPRHHHSDSAAPQIQQPVFLREKRDDGKEGKITPYRMIHPAFWGRLNGEAITPIQPADVLAAQTAAIFGAKPNPQYVEPFHPLTKDQIVQVLTKLEAYKPTAQRLTQNIPNPIAATSAPATTPTTQPAPPYLAGIPVYVTGGKAYRLSNDKKDLTPFDNDAAKPYAWAIGHNVRPAQQALGARGCTDCHSTNAPIFDGKVHSDTLLTGAVTTATMNDLRHEHGVGALTAFALTYPMRPMLIAIGYGSAVVLTLVVLNYALRAVSLMRRR